MFVQVDLIEPERIEFIDEIGVIKRCLVVLVAVGTVAQQMLDLSLGQHGQVMYAVLNMGGDLTRRLQQRGMRRWEWTIELLVQSCASMWCRRRRRGRVRVVGGGRSHQTRGIDRADATRTCMTRRER